MGACGAMNDTAHYNAVAYSAEYNIIHRFVESRSYVLRITSAKVLRFRESSIHFGVKFNRQVKRERS